MERVRGGRGGKLFEIARPRSRGWKNFGGWWTISCPCFYYCFCYYNTVDNIYQPCIPSWSFSKWDFWHLYGITIWKFDREPIKYLMIFLIYVSLIFRRKTKHLFLHSSIQTKEVVKYKKLGCRAIFRTLSNIYDGPFLRKYNG